VFADLLIRLSALPQSAGLLFAYIQKDQPEKGLKSNMVLRESIAFMTSEAHIYNNKKIKFSADGGTRTPTPCGARS
jgi:hypothetical protein